MGLARALGLCDLLESSTHFPAVSSSQGERQLLLLTAQFPGQPFPHRVVIGNTIGCATGCGGPVGWGCYSLHILKRGVPAGCFPGFARRIVIQRTFSHCRCTRIYRNTADFLFSISSCYCLHIFTVYRRFPRVSTTADKENAGLLSTAQFYVQHFSFVFQIAYPPTAQANTIWPAKSSPRPPQKNSHPPRCYPAHISKILKILSTFLRPLSHSKNIFCGNLCCG